MDPGGDRGEGLPPSTTTLCGEHKSQSKAQRMYEALTSESDPSPLSSRTIRSSSEPLTSERTQLTFQFDQELSNVSFKSDGSRKQHHDFKSSGTPSSDRVDLQNSDVQIDSSSQQLKTQLDSIFVLLEDHIVTFVKKELKKIQKVLSSHESGSIESQKDDIGILEGEDKELSGNNRQALMKIILNFLRMMKQEELADRLQNKNLVAVCQHKLKSGLKKRFQYVFEGITKAGSQTLLNQIYTDLFITKGGTGEVNEEHEVRQIEAASMKQNRLETTIRTEDLFNVPSGRDQPIRTVMTKGVAGIGKTLLTQKFSLDWSEGKANQNIQFLFPFTFRELNVLKEKRFSLVELVHHFFVETKEICSFENLQVLFIFDGLDESRLPLDFHNKEILTDVTESTSVDVLLTNLIRGKLLPSAFLWLTTRRAAASRIPPECVGMVTEVRGFSESQKEKYFRKRFRGQEKASRIVSHMKTSKSIRIMCHIPVFCWITATVLEDVLETRGGRQLPNTLTEMYIHFLVVQTKVKKVKYDKGAETDQHWSPENIQMIESLGKLAFDQLQKGNLIFYESDLAECGIDITTASVYSGLFTQIFKEERALYQDKVFCFVHLTVQEFVAALHVHLTFFNSGVNLLEEAEIESKGPEEISLHKIAIDQALQSPNGHLDLFLRFLLGLSLKTNQKLLQGLLTQTGCSSQTNPETIEYIKEKISENVSAEKNINLFHCLNELHDCSLVEEIQNFLVSGHLSADEMSPSQWSALGFILISSGKDLNMFDLKKYSASEEVFLRLLPVVKVSTKMLLSDSNLSDRTCEALSSVLCSQSSNQIKLDLSNNKLQDSGMKLLSIGLESPNCKLETLSLSGCLISKEGCASLALALNSNPYYLKELDLSNNDLGDSGVKMLSNGLKDLSWRLETLRLSGCDLSEQSCEALASVLSSQSSSLRELDLCNNNLGDSGVKILSAGLESPNCKLETLRLSRCDILEGSCEALASVLSSQSISLKELNLSNNNLHNSGGKNISVGLKSQNCKLETLSLSGCLISEEGCASLASALNSNPSHLKKLDLSYNHPGDSGLKLLLAGVKDPHWRLEDLRVEPAGIRWLNPGPWRYFCLLTFDTNAVSRYLKLSEDNKKVTFDHLHKFDYWPQLLCTNALTGRHYWEVEWRGRVDISVSYSRNSKRKEPCFGRNNQSWSLSCFDDGYSVWHNDIETHISSPISNRVAVYVDCPAGVLSFYKVSPESLILLHTFNATFTEPLFPGFEFRWHRSGSSVLLC